MVNWRQNNQALNLFGAGDNTALQNASIVFVVGSVSISGGTNLILEYASHLQDMGAKVTIAHILGKSGEANWHPASSKLQISNYSDLAGNYSDLAIATWWPTVYELPKIKYGRAVYFVQSLESRFSLSSSDYLNECLAAATYLMGIPMITVSSWLQNLMHAATGTPTWLVKNGIDKTRFPISQTISRPTKSSKENLRVLVEGFAGAEMKAITETIASVKACPAPVELWYVSPVKKRPPHGPDKVFKAVPHDQMHQIYSDVDLLVKMSRVEGMFGPPLEAFHSGSTAIVSKVTGFSEYIEPGKNSIAVEVDDFQAVPVALQELASNNDLLESLKLGALETAKSWPSIKETSFDFAAACNSMLYSKALPRDLASESDAWKKRIEQALEAGEDPRVLFSPLLVTSRL